MSEMVRLNCGFDECAHNIHKSAQSSFPPKISMPASPETPPLYNLPFLITQIIKYLNGNKLNVGTSC